MAIEQVQNLPQQYVTDLGVDYGKQLAGLTSIPLDTAKLAPQVAGQDALQTQSYNLAGSGVGAYNHILHKPEHLIHNKQHFQGHKLTNNLCLRINKM